MPRAQPGQRFGGREKGSLNKKTIARLEREQIAEQVRAEIMAANRATTEEAKRRAKDVMEEFLPVLRGIAAYYQPTFPGMPSQNINGNEVKFREWLVPLLDLCGALAKFQSPTYRAVAVFTPPPPVPASETSGNVISLNDPVALMRVYQRRVQSKRPS